MRKVNDRWKKEKREKRMGFLVVTYVIASQSPERRPTGTPHACANSKQINGFWPQCISILFHFKVFTTSWIWNSKIWIIISRCEWQKILLIVFMALIKTVKQDYVKIVLSLVVFYNCQFLLYRKLLYKKIFRTPLVLSDKCSLTMLYDKVRRCLKVPGCGLLLRVIFVLLRPKAEPFTSYCQTPSVRSKLGVDFTFTW